MNLSTKEIADFFMVDPKTIHRWTDSSILPKALPNEFSNYKYWHKLDIEKYFFDQILNRGVNLSFEYTQSNFLNLKLITLNDILRKTGKSKSLIYSLIKKGKFPKHIFIGKRTSRWLLKEVDAWIIKRICLRHSHFIL